jgi:hypothetical protein
VQAVSDRPTASGTSSRRTADRTERVTFTVVTFHECARSAAEIDRMDGRKRHECNSCQ